MHLDILNLLIPLPYVICNTGIISFSRSKKILKIFFFPSNI